ncbi:hypothetical protein G5B30_11970 [Sphingobacterium sp. SGG-5]|uniref:DUF4998 domain-containing protein n=1 Tax=Sphingobacterium sp. SGG-5 TaxID=2710881 RepID=UPI0013EA994C|nr:DUF4998 domain-containing protein [Sphingobacterium sp. SGG-5]NGM62632.1 hypothetical protein [Sphingobacterium sp. SGG-5]
MKNNRISFLIALFVLMGFLFSCKEMDYTYRQFVEDGETVYISKADSIVVRGGNQRAEVSWLLLSDPKVTKYKMYWNNRKDSVEGSIQKTEKVDTIKVMVNNLAEGVHEFEIFLYDKLGNTSIRSSKVGRVYGQRFQSSLYNRVIRSMKRVNARKDLDILWLAADNEIVYSDIKYNNVDGEEVTVKLKAQEETLVLPGFTLDGDFYIRTAFLPDTLALDTFYVDFERVEVPPAGVEIRLDKSLWKNPGIGNKGEYYTTARAAGTAFEKIWDGIEDQNGYYRMSDAAAVPSPPSSFAIDLGAKYILTKMRLHTLAHSTIWAYNNGAPKKFEVYVSNTGSSNWDDWVWVQLGGEFEVIKPSGSSGVTDDDMAFAQAGHDFTFPESEDEVGYRYVRFRTMETWKETSKDITIAELTFWGYEK